METWKEGRKEGRKDGYDQPVACVAWDKSLPVLASPTWNTASFSSQYHIVIVYLVVCFTCHITFPISLAKLLSAEIFRDCATEGPLVFRSYNPYSRCF